METQRRCSKCLREQPLENYYVGAVRQDGKPYRITVCKTCIRRQQAIRYANRVGGITRPPRRNARGEYRCPRCQQYLSRDEFRATREPSRPVAAYCKRCERTMTVERKQRNWRRAVERGDAVAW